MPGTLKKVEAQRAPDTKSLKSKDLCLMENLIKSVESNQKLLKPHSNPNSNIVGCLSTMPFNAENKNVDAEPHYAIPISPPKPVEQKFPNAPKNIDCQHKTEANVTDSNIEHSIKQITNKEEKIIAQEKTFMMKPLQNTKHDISQGDIKHNLQNKAISTRPSLQNTENSTSDENNLNLNFFGKVQNDMNFVGKLDTKPTQTNENIISCGEGKNRSKSVENSRHIKESKVNSNSQIDKDNQIKPNDDDFVHPPPKENEYYFRWRDKTK